MLEFLNGFLDSIFGWALGLSYFWAIFVLTLVISLFITIIYKYTTNQSLMKDLKSEIKELQKGAKELRSEPQKMLEVQKKMMETNMKYMMHSMRSMLFTFIPIIIMFGWMSSHFAYIPIIPGEEFNVEITTDESFEGNIRIMAPEGINVIGEPEKAVEDGKVSWKLMAGPGNYILEFWNNDISYTKKVEVTNEKRYEDPVKRIDKDGINDITVVHKPVKIINLYVGGWKLGWLGTYILFSIIFSIVLRKLLKVY